MDRVLDIHIFDALILRTDMYWGYIIDSVYTGWCIVYTEPDNMYEVNKYMKYRTETRMTKRREAVPTLFLAIKEKLDYRRGMMAVNFSLADVARPVVHGGACDRDCFPAHWALCFG